MYLSLFVSPPPHAAAALRMFSLSRFVSNNPNLDVFCCFGLRWSYAKSSTRQNSKRSVASKAQGNCNQSVSV